MSDDDKSLIKIDSLPGEQLYEDMVGPIASEFGEIGRSLLSFARIPLQHGSERLEALLEDATEDVPEDKQVPPHPAVGAPIVDNALLLPEDDPLREMFRLLLTRAINEDEQEHAHPAFAKIITRLAPDEAHLLFRLSQRERLSHRTLKKRKDFDGKIGDLEEEAPGKRFRRIDDSIYDDFVYQPEKFDWLDFPENTRFYIDHLESLGLIQRQPSFDDGTIFTCPNKSDQIAELTKNYIFFTSFGHRFCKSCVPTDPRENWDW